MVEISSFVSQLQQGDYKILARAITMVENNLDGSNALLEEIEVKNIPLIGITGPPGAGKSTLVNALISLLLKQEKKIGVIAVDPSSPFNFGSLLGDRIRLSEYFSHPNIFIRSLATRGSLGGLSEKIIEITDVMKAAQFDFLFVETVGVGQSEVEIAALADTTVVVLVPDSGDEVQTMKAGLMEIADIFVVNKADHADADRFAKNLTMLSSAAVKAEWQIPVLKTIAITGEGIEKLWEQIQKHNAAGLKNERRTFLLSEKIWKIIEKEKMKNLDRKTFFEAVKSEVANGESNVYKLAKKFL